MSIFIPSNHDMVNCLNLESPESYSGHIWQYHVSHLELILTFSVFHESHYSELFVHMVQVRYIDLPTSWTGGNLKTGSVDECLAMMNETYFLKNLPSEQFDQAKELLLEHFRLFVIDTPQKQYKILAAAGINVYTNPVEYFDNGDGQVIDGIKVVAGRPFIQGKSMVAVEDVLGDLAHGNPIQMILEARGLELEDVFACLHYAQRLVKNKPQ